MSDSHFKEVASSYAFYVIGDDDQSIAWAKKNAAYLKQIHALGIVTNIQSEERLKAIEDETGLWLTTANLDGLMQTVQTNHYPFLVYKGWCAMTDNHNQHRPKKKSAIWRFISSVLWAFFWAFVFNHAQSL